MPRINSTQFGFITIDDVMHDQVLIVGDLVKERDYTRLKKTYDSSHKIGKWEAEELLADNPEMIIIGSGQSGKLEVEQWFLDKMKEHGVEVVVLSTPEATGFYNQKKEEGKRVNALMHTTC